ncbi:hypothetical protein ScalyP_jg11040 [Parmales sp. scaly parma]|nr:hypothetical protein ScalyP_jg11040 [Parmales sp. scaly parma]
MSCEICEIGKFSDSDDPSLCTSCGSGFTTLTAGSTSPDDCFLFTLICASDQYPSEGECKQCNNLGSIIFLVFSLFSFILGALAVERMSQTREQLIFLKVFSTFCQCIQLTTLIKIKWPRFALFTIPFAFPISDTRCLAGGIGLTQLHNFYMIIYIPLATFVYLGSSIRRTTNIVKKTALIETLGFLVLLWYSPVLQMVGSMFDCFDDVELGWVLLADPNVSCVEGFSRTLIVYHALVICAVVGVGFPAIIFVTTRRLRSKGQLDAESMFAPVFEFYRSNAPYFESFHLLRKGLLILLVSIFSEPTSQSFGAICTNLLFWAALERTEPMIHQPSSIFKGKSLFHLIERGAAMTTILGNLFALSGAFNPTNEDVETILGVLFTTVNLTFVTALFISFNRDLSNAVIIPYASELKIEQEVELGPSLSKNNMRTESLRVDVGKDFEALEATWIRTAASIASSTNKKEKLKMLGNLPFMRTKIYKTVRTRLLTLDATDVEKGVARVVFEMDEFLGGMVVEGDEEGKEVLCREIMKNDNLSAALRFVLEAGGDVGARFRQFDELKEWEKFDECVDEIGRVLAVGGEEEWEKKGVDGKARELVRCGLFLKIELDVVRMIVERLNFRLDNGTNVFKLAIEMKQIRDAIRILDSFGKEAWENGVMRTRSEGGKVEQVSFEAVQLIGIYIYRTFSGRKDLKKDLAKRYKTLKIGRSGCWCFGREW